MKIIEDFGRIVVMPSPGEIVPSSSCIESPSSDGKMLVSFSENLYPRGLNPVEILQIFISRITDRPVPIKIKRTGLISFVFILADSLEIPMSMFLLNEGVTVTEVAQTLKQCENRIREWLPGYLVANPGFEIEEV